MLLRPVDPEAFGVRDSKRYVIAPYVLDFAGGDGETRTRDLRRDRPAF